MSSPPPPTSIGLWARIHLGIQLHMHVGNGPRTGWGWKKKLNIWPKVNKDWEELLCVSGLTHTLLHSSSLGRMPTPFLSRCLFALFCLKQFLCVLSHLLCCVSNNKLWTYFYLLEKCSFSVGSRARGTLFLASTPGWQGARSQSFLSGYPGPISGQRTKILLWATAQHCPSDIRRGSQANGYDFPRSSVGKESACNAGDTGSIPGLGRSPGKGKWQPTPVFLPGEFYGQRSLAGYSPQGHKSWTRLSD